MKNFIKILILIFAFYSCSKDNIIDNTNKINSDIKVTLIEELSETQNILNINSETIEIQPCINTSLLTKYEQIGNKIVIDYEGISTPNVCLTALGPAITGYSYNLESEEYEVEFINDGISNYVSLLIDNEKYTIIKQSINNIQFQRDTLYKILPNTYWGTVGYHQESTLELVEDFVDNLKQQNANFKTYKNGDYGHFMISSGEIQPPTNHGYYFIKTIIFEYNGDFEELKNNILQFAELNKSNLSLSFMNNNGKKISIWN